MPSERENPDRLTFGQGLREINWPRAILVWVACLSLLVAVVGGGRASDPDRPQPPNPVPPAAWICFTVALAGLACSRPRGGR